MKPMICPRCGLSHPCSDFYDGLPDCVSALKAKLRRRDLVASNLYEACKAAREHFFFQDCRIWRSSTVGIYNQLQDAIKSAEEDLCHDVRPVM